MRPGAAARERHSPGRRDTPHRTETTWSSGTSRPGLPEAVPSVPVTPPSLHQIYGSTRPAGQARPGPSREPSRAERPARATIRATPQSAGAAPSDLREACLDRLQTRLRLRHEWDRDRCAGIPILPCSLVFPKGGRGAGADRPSGTSRSHPCSAFYRPARHDRELPPRRIRRCRFTPAASDQTASPL